MTLLDKAKTLAIKAHGNQKRRLSDIPFVNHTIRVAHKASEFGMSENAIAAAYLHDVIEDTKVTTDQLRIEFPNEVVDLVTKLTNTWADNDPKPEKDSKKPQYYSNLLKSHDAICLKLLDRADNLLSMVGSIEEENGPKDFLWAKRTLNQTKKEFDPLINSCQNPKIKSYFLDTLNQVGKQVE